MAAHVLSYSRTRQLGPRRRLICACCTKTVPRVHKQRRYIYIYSIKSVRRASHARRKLFNECEQRRRLFAYGFVMKLRLSVQMDLHFAHNPHIRYTTILLYMGCQERIFVFNQKGNLNELETKFIESQLVRFYEIIYLLIIH